MKSDMKKILIVLLTALVLPSCRKETDEVYTPKYEEQSIELPGVPNARQLGDMS